MVINKILNHKKVLLFILFTPILAVFIYSRILQAHADEGGKLFDDRCNNVNPTLIAYKNSYIQMWRLIKNNGNQEEAKNKFMDYQNGIKKYLPLESDWLKKQSDFTTRWDFQFFEPDYVKNLAKLQIAMYQAERDNSANILSLFENPKTTENFDASTVKRFQEASAAYFKAYDEANKIDDWRKLLWKQPDINCPEQNLIIPDTSLDKIFPSPVPSKSADQEKSG